MPIILRLKIDGSKRVLRGHDHFWNILREQTLGGNSTTALAVAKECQPGVDADLRDFIRRLVKGGFAVRNDAGRIELLQRPVLTPRLNRDGSICPQWYGPQQMWTVLRRRIQGTTVRDLAMDASTDDIQVSKKAAEHYLRGLKAAGLVVVTKQADRTSIYRLAPGANTGPMAPRVMRSSMVFDLNTARIAGTDIEAEEVLT